jgi:hypothetical protein
MLRLGFLFVGMTEHLGIVLRFYEMQRPGEFGMPLRAA